MLFYISKISIIFRHNFRHTKTFFKKNTPMRNWLYYNHFRMLFLPHFSPISPIFGTKPLPCRRFLQHYYRDTFIESHRKPIEVLEMSYSGRLISSMLALIPQSGDFSGAALAVRSVALLQVAKWSCSPQVTCGKQTFIQPPLVNIRVVTD